MEFSRSTRARINPGSSAQSFKTQQRTQLHRNGTARRDRRLFQASQVAGRPRTSNGPGACRSKSSGIP
jgi:hypothetical protein